MRRQKSSDSQNTMNRDRPHSPELDQEVQDVLAADSEEPDDQAITASVENLT